MQGLGFRASGCVGGVRLQAVELQGFKVEFSRLSLVSGMSPGDLAWTLDP